VEKVVERADFAVAKRDTRTGTPILSSQRGGSSLPPFIVKSATLDTEPTVRPHTSMSLREENSRVPITSPLNSTSNELIAPSAASAVAPSVASPAEAVPLAPGAASVAAPVLLESTARPRGRTWSNAAREKEAKPTNLSQDSPNIEEQYEEGIIWEYDAAEDTWSRGLINFRLDKKSFAEGSLRAAHAVQIYGGVKPTETPAKPELLVDKQLKVCWFLLH